MSKPAGYPFVGEDTGLNVIVVGAGLGGLACAIECRRKGHRVTVFENAPEIMRIGAAPVRFQLTKAIRWYRTVEGATDVGNWAERWEIDPSMGSTRSDRSSVWPHGSLLPFQERRKVSCEAEHVGSQEWPCS
jgi:choline dehydrogenase-like flavoprotein